MPLGCSSRLNRRRLRQVLKGQTVKPVLLRPGMNVFTDGSAWLAVDDKSAEGGGIQSAAMT
jgi:hypothetical protein